MVKTFRRIVITALLLILIAGALCAVVLSGGCSASASDPLADAKNGAVNAILDASGVKNNLDSELRAKGGEVASRYGISQAFVDEIVDSLAIEDWKATSLPEGVTQSDTFSVDAEGTPVKVTTYDDPGVVTVDMYGQSVTLAVPESAQGYVPYFQYFQYIS